MNSSKNQLSSDIAEAGKQSCAKEKYEEDKTHILSESMRFFTPSLRWIESTHRQFSAAGKNIRDYFLIETFEAFPLDSFSTPRVRYVWVNMDSSEKDSSQKT